MKKAAVKTVWQLLIAAAVLLAVWAVAYFAVGNGLLLPSFFDCLKASGTFLVNAAFWQAFCATLFRVALAFLCSFVLAVVFAVIAYLLPTFGGIFAPIVAVMRSMPVLAVLLIVLVWTSAGLAPVIVAFLSLFPMLYTGIYSALSGVDEKLIEMSRVYNVPLKRRITQLYIPTILPTLATVSGAAFAFSLKLVVSAEVLARTKESIGTMLQETQIYSQTAETFALVMLTCVLGVCVEALGALLEKVLRRSVR